MSGLDWTIFWVALATIFLLGLCMEPLDRWIEQTAGRRKAADLLAFTLFLIPAPAVYAFSAYGGYSYMKGLIFAQ